MQNELLAHHPNASLYTHMSQFVEIEGYYLESEPCLVCNNPEVPLTTIKLSAIKVSWFYNFFLLFLQFQILGRFKIHHHNTDCKITK